MRKNSRVGGKTRNKQTNIQYLYISNYHFEDRLRSYFQATNI